MNANHQRHLVSAFGHIDRLLAAAREILADTEAASPFSQYTQDVSPVQRKVVEDHIRRVRETMDRLMNDLHLSRPQPICGTL